MSLNRIQKLLFSEYCDFEDMVLVESPFAQTTREGLGLRQVQLGLTPTKLVLAVDILPPINQAEIFCNNIDPEIETLELIAVYPVECVNLSVFRRRKRQSLKAHFCNNRILYFELGGFENRKMFWNLWCERVRFLCPEEGASSISETSVATSTSASASTLNIVSTSHKIGTSGKRQFWCKFNRDKEKDQNCKWVENYLYMDKIDKDGYGTEFYWPSEIKKNKTSTKEDSNESKDMQISNNNKQGVNAGCGTDLYLNLEEFLEPNKGISETSTESTGVFTLYPVVSSHLSQMSENAVQKWEMARHIPASRGRHPRRYAFMPQPHFLYGLGPWNIHIGDRVSTQMKRSVSAVGIRRQPDDPNLCLPISKRLLTVSVSCETFHMARGLNVDTCVSKLAVPGPKALLFWTPEYWYRPQPAYDSYNNVLEHLRTLKQNLEQDYYKNNKKKKHKKKKIKPISEGEYDDSKPNEKNFEIYLHRLRTALKIEVALTAWDFDSTTLAYQLTMIDKELFLKISPQEFQAIIWQRSSKNAPNVNSFIAFSHRVRSRLIVRFINAADKCDRISSYQSCKSILSGLQNVSIFRLQNTWAYLRLHHALKYQLFENLCRRYSDPRLLIYQKSFHLATVSAPYLPYIGDLLARLLDKVSPIPDSYITQITLDKSNSKLVRFDNEKDSIKYHIETRKKNRLAVSYKILKFFSSFKLWPSFNTKNEISDKVTFKKNKENKKKVTQVQSEVKTNEKYKSYEDNRAKRLQEIVVFLEICQKSAAKYALSKNELAKEYLLKARYREDRENFYNCNKTDNL